MSQILSFLLQNPEKTNVLATVFSALTAFLAALVALFSIWISVRSLKIQDRHNQLSVKPLPRISLDIWDNFITLSVFNHGSGPLIILEILMIQGQIKSNQMDTFFPKPPPLVEGEGAPVILTPGITLKPGSELPIFRARVEVKDAASQKFKEEIIETIFDLRFELKYTDIYENDFTMYVREMRKESQK